MKKILASILCVALLLTLTGCGKGESRGADGKNSESSESIIFKNDSSVELGTPSETLDPAEVYKNITYAPEMFYGTYRIAGGEAAEKEFLENEKYFTYKGEEKEKKLTKLPYKIEAGKNNMHHVLNDIEEYNWISVWYGYEYNPENNKKTTDILYCAYTVEGNKLVLNPLKHYETDSNNNKITYEFSEETLEYEFSFSGRELTLSSGDDSVVLTSCLDAYGEKEHFSVNAYLSDGSDRLGDIDYIRLYYNEEDDYTRAYFETTDGEASYDAIARYDKNGLLTFTVPLESGTKTYQYVAFFCFWDGIILTNGKDTYYYNDSWSDRNKKDASKYVSEDMTGKISELSEDKLKEIVEKKDNLMDELAKAFESAGIKVTVDPDNGEIRMDSSVLFGGDSAELSVEGKELLNKFIKAYTSIVFSDKYRDFVQKTIIEGHTAPLANSTYESGLPLSVERANVVKDYCLSSETNVDTKGLSSSLEAKGMSNEKPIMDADGNVDLNASRRVSFRFIINIQ